MNRPNKHDIWTVALALSAALAVATVLIRTLPRDLDAIPDPPKPLRPSVDMPTVTVVPNRNRESVDIPRNQVIRVVDQDGRPVQDAKVERVAVQGRRGPGGYRSAGLTNAQGIWVSNPDSPASGLRISKSGYGACFLPEVVDAVIILKELGELRLCCYDEFGSPLQAIGIAISAAPLPELVSFDPQLSEGPGSDRILVAATDARGIATFPLPHGRYYTRYSVSGLVPIIIDKPPEQAPDDALACPGEYRIRFVEPIGYNYKVVDDIIIGSSAKCHNVDRIGLEARTAAYELARDCRAQHPGTEVGIMLPRRGHEEPRLQGLILLENAGLARIDLPLRRWHECSAEESLLKPVTMEWPDGYGDVVLSIECSSGRLWTSVNDEARVLVLTRLPEGPLAVNIPLDRACRLPAGKYQVLSGSGTPKSVYGTHFEVKKNTSDTIRMRLACDWALCAIKATVRDNSLPVDITIDVAGNHGFHELITAHDASSIPICVPLGPATITAIVASYKADAVTVDIVETDTPLQFVIPLVPVQE